MTWWSSCSCRGRAGGIAPHTAPASPGGACALTIPCSPSPTCLSPQPAQLLPQSAHLLAQHEQLPLCVTQAPRQEATLLLPCHRPGATCSCECSSISSTSIALQCVLTCVVRGAPLSVSWGGYPTVACSREAQLCTCTPGWPHNHGLARLAGCLSPQAPGCEAILKKGSKVWRKQTATRTHTHGCLPKLLLGAK